MKKMIELNSLFSIKINIYQNKVLVKNILWKANFINEEETKTDLLDLFFEKGDEPGFKKNDELIQIKIEYNAEKEINLGTFLVTNKKNDKETNQIIYQLCGVLRKLEERISGNYRKQSGFFIINNILNKINLTIAKDDYNSFGVLEKLKESNFENYFYENKKINTIFREILDSILDTKIEFNANDKGEIFFYIKEQKDFGRSFKIQNSFLKVDQDDLDSKEMKLNFFFPLRACDFIYINSIKSEQDFFFKINKVSGEYNLKKSSFIKINLNKNDQKMSEVERFLYNIENKINDKKAFNSLPVLAKIIHKRDNSLFDCQILNSKTLIEKENSIIENVKSVLSINSVQENDIVLLNFLEGDLLNPFIQNIYSKNNNIVSNGIKGEIMGIISFLELSMNALKEDIKNLNKSLQNEKIDLKSDGIIQKDYEIYKENLKSIIN